MRKNIFALSLILPLLFLFSVFSTAKTVSLGVRVSASGIELVDVPQNGYRIDISAQEEEICLKAKVLPEAAFERGYFYRVEGDAVTVEADGRLRAQRTGEATVTAVSRDGGFTDSVKVAVYASKPYEIAFSLRDPVSGKELLTPTAEGYTAELPTGLYSYQARAIPGGAAPAVVASGGAVLERGANSLFLPFSGEHVLEVSLAGSWKGEERQLKKRVTLMAKKFVTQSGFVVNGGNPTLALEREKRSASFYIEGEETPEIAPCFQILQSNVERLGENRYRADIFFESAGDFSFFVTDGSGERREEVFVIFSDFDFTVRPDLPVQTEEPTVLKSEPVAFYAAPAVPAEGVSYLWEAEGDALIAPAGGTCVLTARGGDLLLHVKAVRGEKLLAEKTVRVGVVERLRTVQFTEKTDRGLAKCLVAAGKRYEDETLVQNKFPLRLVLSDGERECGAENVSFFVSDETVAEIGIENGVPVLLPKGTGEIAVTAAWRGNASYGENVASTLKLYVAGEAVETDTSARLFRAADAGREIVLTSDLLLGTDDAGEPLSLGERAAMFRKTPSTFNVEYYKNASTERPENAAVQYVLEFKNNVYGNGYALNAQLFTAEKDGAAPRFFRGPLCFVKFGQLASVAAQDNISFLVRTDGVTLHNLTLLGCGDELLNTDGGYDLSRLNTVGTVLEVNADCDLINCRVRNGRTVVRAYGGNREGDRYFSPRPAEEERIHVRIEGCTLSQGREFLLKIGANAAVRASASDREPDLLGYSIEDDHLSDDEFYRRCVFTDVTLKDSVLETSGLFCVGVESNFAGVLLSEGGSGGFDGWAGTGGTSYASLLRLSGDVRLYDWKDVALIDSSTLIETELSQLKLDLAAMLTFVASKRPEEFGSLLEETDGVRYVHGGIAFYGGGKNYSMLQDGSGSDLREYRVDLSALGEAEGDTGYQGQILPAAAGTQDFRFYLYGTDGANNRAAHLREAQEGKKYEGLLPLPPF